MKLEVGNYVRTEKGIAKYLGLGKDVLKEETNKNTYEYYYNQHIFDNYIFNVEHDYGDTLTNDEFNNIDKLGKVKESIIDLIEVGDYVNGHRVSDIYEDINGQIRMKFGESGLVLAHKSNYDNYYLFEDEIKSIVTKEQFESRKYEVE